MGERIEPLSTTECKTIADALYKLVNECPERGGLKAEFDALGANQSLAVFVVSGRYKKKYVSGSFSAEVTFSVGYKGYSNTSDQRIDQQEFVGEIVTWLESAEDLPRLTDNRTITKINALGVPYKGEAEKNGSITYYADAVMEYMKKGA